MTTRRFIFVFFINLLAFTGYINAQGSNSVISLTDVHIPGIIISGSYSQLIESQGYPNSYFTSSINPISSRCLKEGNLTAPKHKVQCEYLVYDAYEYVHVGDSVQLVFVDLRKTDIPICINNLVITKKTTQSFFCRK